MALQFGESFQAADPEGCQPKSSESEDEQIEVRVLSLDDGECDNEGREKVAHNEEGYHLSLIKFSNRFCVINGHTKVS
jgi:hypothetical protein